jgi:O-antigen/teichoic acid export membrane protein
VVRVWRASVRKLALVVIPAFFFLMGFAEDFIVTLYTTNYSDSVDVFRIYLLLVPLHMFVLSLLPQVFGKTKVSLQITFVAVGTNVIMSLVLLKTIGYYGPAIATVLSSYLAAGLFFAIACRLLCCSVKDLLPAVEIVKMTIVTGITTGLSLLILSGLHSPFLRLMVGFQIYCAIYVVGGILVGMFTSDDKRLIRKWTVDLVMTRK